MFLLFKINIKIFSCISHAIVIQYERRYAHTTKRGSFYMNFNSRRLFLNFSLMLCPIYLFNFLLYYFANHFFDSDILYYFSLFASKALYFLIPLMGCALMLAARPFVSTRALALSSIGFAAARLVYSLPYFYISLIASGFYQTDAAIYAIGSAIIEAVIVYGATLLVSFLYNLITRERSELSYDEAVVKPTRLDFSDPISLSFALSSLLVFCYYFVTEVVRTVSFIIDYSFSFTAEELIFTLASYLSDILIPILCYTVQSYIKNRVIAKRYGFDSSTEC